MPEKLLFLIACFIPFQFALSPSSSVDLASLRVVIILLFLYWLFQGLLKRKLPLPIDSVSLFLYTFLFLASFSLFWAENPFWGMRKLLFLFSIFPIYLVFSGFKNEAFPLKIMKGLIWGSSVLSLIAILQFSSQFIFGIEKVFSFWGKNITPIFLGNAFSTAVLENQSWLVNISGKTVFRAISVFPDPHMLSFYLGMTAPLALTAYYHSQKKSGFFLMAFSVIFAATLLTFSRGGYLGLAAALIIIVAYFTRNMRLSVPDLIRTFFIIISISGVLYAITPLRDRFLASFDFQEGSNRGRIELWGKAVQTISENPLGVGIGNLPLAFLPTAEYRDPIYAHSLYLDIATEMGILALLSFLAILGLAIHNFWKLSRANILYLGPLASLVYFTAYSLVETPLYSVHVLTLLLILLSFSTAYGNPKNY